MTAKPALTRTSSKAKKSDEPFEGLTADEYIRRHPAAPLPLSEHLAWEKELLGVYLSGHPLDEYAQELGAFELDDISLLTAPAEEGESLFEGPCTLGGMITALKRLQTKNNKPYLRLRLEDRTGSTEVFVWYPVSTKYPALTTGAVVVCFCEAKVNDRGMTITLKTLRELST